jgi:hypothetical protein
LWTSFLPPVKRRHEDRVKMGLLLNREQLNDNIEKANKRLKTNHQEVKMDEEEIILTSSNEEEVQLRDYFLAAGRSWCSFGVQGRIHSA